MRQMVERREAQRDLNSERDDNDIWGANTDVRERAQAASGEHTDEQTSAQGERKEEHLLQHHTIKHLRASRAAEGVAAVGALEVLSDALAGKSEPTPRTTDLPG
jgi:hypothetical protein